MLVRIVSVIVALKLSYNMVIQFLHLVVNLNSMFFVAV